MMNPIFDLHTAIEQGCLTIREQAELREAIRLGNKHMVTLMRNRRREREQRARRKQNEGG